MTTATQPIQPAPVTVDITVRRSDGTFVRFHEQWINWFNSLTVKADAINANIVAIQFLNGQGYITRVSVDQWITRTFQAEVGQLVVTNGSGVDGNTSYGLADVTQAAAGSFIKIIIDSFGRVSGNTPVVLSDLITLLDGGLTANQFYAKASAGNYSAKSVTDNALLLLGDTIVPRIGIANDWQAVQRVTNASGGRVELNGAQLTTRGFDFLTNGILRWRFVCGGPAESGGNAGSNFACIAYDDVGVAIGSVYTIDRASRTFGFQVVPNVLGTNLALLTQTISNGDTTHAPSADAVFDIIAGLGGTYQPLDATLTALSGQNWALNALPIGTGPDTLNQVTFAANTFPARASTGDLVAKTITDGSLTALAGSGGTGGWLRGDGTVSATLIAKLRIEQSSGVITEFSANATTPPPITGLSGWHMIGPDAGFPFGLVDSFGAGSGGLVFRKSGGTAASPTATPANQQLGQFQGRCYGSTGYPNGAACSINFNSAGLATDTSTPGQIQFRTTPSGAITPVVRWTVESNGDFQPVADATYNIGTSVNRVAVAYILQLALSGSEYHTGEQAVSLTANTDNLAINSTTRVLRVSSNNAYNLTGLTGGAAGRRLTLLNVSAFTITLTHDATSTAANRFFCPNNTNVAVRQNGSVEVIYDATSSRYRVIGA